ncbi:hypothetical protein OBBRIDRAFT_891808 [Obba rivulosa]|uniref:Acyl-CoA desaturase n=1 Tax=Obba rivulosa TaxID=1052685 RepID=A0A8E2DEY5_9APHY|nr:hypothetical protein OBBRIDRAFT_891808 [Obba rivulosa]
MESIVKRIRWPNATLLTVSPILAVYGAMTTPLHQKTLVLSMVFYVISMLGVTAGCHRLYSHRSYVASKPLEIFLNLAAASAAQGSSYWWARDHRAHHRYTDTDLDPYSAQRGLLWSHIGWMFLKSDTKPGRADISDLKKNPILQWQQRWYWHLMLVFGYILPTAIAGYFWNDWRGGFYYAAMVRTTIAHHCTFCINSLAHWLGEHKFDDKHSPRDHVFTALITMGEGYHNFHHQYPIDYRNAIRWWQYDPTKWFIGLCGWLGLASSLHTFPDNEVQKGAFTMQMKRLKSTQDGIKWPVDSNELPVVTWDEYVEQAKEHPLMLIAGFIHDISDFMDRHPGGRALLLANVGKDATAAFCGGVYEHSNAAHNMLSMMRVGVLLGGVEHVKSIPPAQKLMIVRNGLEEERSTNGNHETCFLGLRRVEAFSTSRY